MRLAQAKAYWKKAATNNLAVQHTEEEKHFFTFTVEDALSSLKNINYPAVGLETPVHRFGDGLSDNIRLLSSGGVLIIKHAPQGNAVKVEEAMLETEEIALQMVSKMRNDRLKANDVGVASPEKLMKHLDLFKVKIEEVGPLFDSCYGWRIDYEFNNPTNLELDEDKWLPATETKWTF